MQSGRLELTKRTADGATAKLSVIGSGHGFGEMALLSCSGRSCTVTARTDVTLYRLPKAEFEEVILHESAFRGMLERKAEDYEQYNRIKLLQPFALLEADQMYAVLQHMTERTYEAGENIIDGEKGDFYYIIK